MFKPVDLLAEVYENCIKDKLNISHGDIVGIVKDDEFYSFDCDIKIVTSDIILEQIITDLEKTIDDYCLDNYNFVPVTYGLFPQKTGKFWLTRFYLHVPQNLFSTYVNYLKIKNDTDKMQWDFKYLC